MTEHIASQNIKKWHVLLTKPNQELRALRNLTQQGFIAYLPMTQKEVIQNNKISVKNEPLFKRYLFVKFDQNNGPLHRIRNTLGTSELIRFGDKLAIIDEAIIESLQSMNFKPKPLYHPGNLLKVTDGPFKDLEAVFKMHDGEQRAMILIELLNKTHKLSLSLDVLKKVDD